MADAAGAAEDTRTRCAWERGPLMQRYHDDEWGVPLRDDRGLFEFLVLEGAQAGLSWETILRKREGYRRAFADFEIERVAGYGATEVDQLLADPGIVRNRKKLAAAAQNARACQALQREHGSLAAYLWQQVGGRPRQNAWRTLAEIPARTAESDALSQELKRRGFAFVGSTICYAFMQAVGMVNDHAVDCFRYKALASQR